MKPVTLKSNFAQVLGWALWAVLTISTVVVGITEGVWALFQTGAAAGFVGMLLHQLLVRPRIRVSDQGVEIVNPFRKFTIAWNTIDRIDTKWGLTVFTENRRVQAWSAPAPGRHSTFRSSKFEGRHLPESSYIAGTIRPGDLVSSDSGAAAYTIRTEWERRRDLGLLTGDKFITESWSWTELATSGALLVAAILLNLN